MTLLDPREALQAAFGDAVIDVVEFRGDITVVVESSRIPEIAAYCRDTPGLEYNFLSDVAGVDYYPQEPRFGVNYQLYSMVHNRSLWLKAYVPGDAAELPTVTAIYPAANWPEREVYDMFGVVFTGHPDLRRILMPPDWDGFPQRKDYPLGYETVQFTANFDEVDRHKPYAQE